MANDVSDQERAAKTAALEHGLFIARVEGTHPDGVRAGYAAVDFETGFLAGLAHRDAQLLKDAPEFDANAAREIAQRIYREDAYEYAERQRLLIARVEGARRQHEQSRVREAYLKDCADRARHAHVDALAEVDRLQGKKSDVMDAAVEQQLETRADVLKRRRAHDEMSSKWVAECNLTDRLHRELADADTATRTDEDKCTRLERELEVRSKPRIIDGLWQNKLDYANQQLTALRARADRVAECLEAALALADQDQLTYARQRIQWREAIAAYREVK